MAQTIQILRTSTNTPPATLLPGALSAELGAQTKLWIGSSGGNRLLLSSDPADSAAAGSAFLKLSGGTLTGLLTLSGPPTVNLHAATKAYVDAGDATLASSISNVQSTYLPLTGGTLTGFLTLSGAPSANLHAATKAYVDARLPIGGGTMTGPLILAADPVTALGAATKQYVDSHVPAGTVTSITAGTGLTGGTITSAGTITLLIPVAVANGGTGGTTAVDALTNLGALPIAGGTVTGNLTINGNASVGGSGGLTVTNGFTASAATITGSGGLTVSANVQINNALAVANSINANALITGGGFFTAGSVQWGPGGSQYYLYGTGGICGLHGTTLGADLFYWNNSRQFYPATDNSSFCGIPGQSWYNVCSYAFSQQSDATLKTDVEALPDCTPLVETIVPTRFKWSEGADTEGTHWGFIAQEVEAAFTAAGYDFAGHQVDPETGLHSLAFNEMTAVLWKAVQELTARVQTLENPA